RLRALDPSPARGSSDRSGKALTDQWILDFVPAEARKPDPLMGWAGSGDMHRQLRLKFPNKEAAVAYAEKYGIDAIVHEPPPRKLDRKSTRLNSSHVKIS